MNIEAPIISGESAAGIQLGSSIEEVLKEFKFEAVCLLSTSGKKTVHRRQYPASLVPTTVR